jgi:hypothetical protein
LKSNNGTPHQEIEALSGYSPHTKNLGSQPRALFLGCGLLRLTGG